MRRRRFIQYGGSGSISFALAASNAHHILASPLTGVFSGKTDDLNLKAFEFSVVHVNQRGITQSHNKYTAKYFSVPLETDLANPIEMVAIQASRSFFMSKYAITQAQWAAVAALPKVTRELNPDPTRFQGTHHPVESVSWLAAMEFCARLSQFVDSRLSQHTGQHISKTYRLPTEVEWEYACRAGTQTPFHTGKTITSQLANYVGTYTHKAEPSGVYRQSTVPVGSFAPNAFGLYDMHGNVWEWCADRWHVGHQSQVRLGQAPLRAIRGGSWSDSPVNIRSASRSGYVETGLNRTIGFRIVTT